MVGSGSAGPAMRLLRGLVLVLCLHYTRFVQTQACKFYPLPRGRSPGPPMRGLYRNYWQCPAGVSYVGSQLHWSGKIFPILYLQYSTLFIEFIGTPQTSHALQGWLAILATIKLIGSSNYNYIYSIYAPFFSLFFIFTV